MRKDGLCKGIVLSFALINIWGCNISEPGIKHISKTPPKPEKETTLQKHYPLPSYQEWKELPFIETNAEPVVTGAEKQRGYIIFQRPITEIVYQNTKPEWFEKINGITSFASKGEFEPLTFSVYPFRELKKFHVEVSDLQCDGNLISKENIDIRLATYWKLRYPRYTSANTYRKVPELLEKVEFHSSPTKECQRYWLTLKTPKNAKAGIYKGKITLTDEGFDKAVVIPLKVRVMDYKLKKDPAKHYTAYTYDLHRRIGRNFKTPEEIAWAEKAIKNDYKAMKDFGFDMPPTLRLGYDPKTGKAFLFQNGAAIEKLKKAGIKGPIPICGGTVFNYLYAKHTGRKVKYYPHWAIPEMPGDDFYKDVTRVFREFTEEAKKKRWPEFIHCPLDEVSAANKEFGARCYKAVKDAGCKVYITKSPSAADAAAYAPYVDIFCSQPFAVDYNKTQNSKHEYWSYPNHNSGETKIPKVMCKGGRMTYGFGLWRSGYTTLIPWIWRWDHNPMFEFNYLKNKKRSECGTQMDKNGNVIPTPYWMCFREGIDDARYIYTLQSAIVEREGTKDPACAKLVKEGKELIQGIWDYINPQQKYKVKGMWPSSDFNAIRWKMALLIEKLLKYPKVQETKAPSVLANTTAKNKTKDLFFENQKAKGNLEIFDLGSEAFDNWKSVTKEGTTSVSETIFKSGKKSLEYKVKIDHKTDGGGEKGNYPIGWPRIRIDFPKNTMDLTKYDYLSMWIMVDSDRDEVADDYTFLSFNLSSWDKDAPRFLFNQELLGAVPQRVWLPVLIPVKEIMEQQGKLDKKIWANIKAMQIWLGESQYQHGDNIVFYIDDISLIKMKSPAIKSVNMPRYFMTPDRYIVAEPQAMGIKNSKLPFIARIIDAKGKTVIEKKVDKLDKNKQIILDAEKLTPGKYQLQIDIGSPAVSSTKQEFEAIKGPCDQ